MWQNNSKLHTSLKQNKTSPWILDKQISRAKMQTAKWNRRQWGWEWSQYYPRACLSDYPLNIPLVRIYISKLMETGAVNMCCLLALDHNRITLARREPGSKFLFCMYFSMKCYFSIIRKFTHESSWSSGSVYLQILQHEATESKSTPNERDANPSQSYPSIKFVGTHWYTWVERSTVRVTCLVWKHNRMSSAGARTQTTRSGTSTRSNYEDHLVAWDSILFSNCWK